MQIPVLVERVKGNGYRARGVEPFAVSARVLRARKRSPSCAPK